MDQSIELFDLRLLNVYSETISDGEGLRYSIYLAGCTHACPGCHNPGSWLKDSGTLLTESMLNRIIGEINNNVLLDGITISGGDPFYDPQGLSELLRRLKNETDKNIWCYTGYTIEEIARKEYLQAPIQYIDVLVDGRFVLQQKDPELQFRGSRNQRILYHPQQIMENLKSSKIENKVLATDKIASNLRC